MSDLDLADGVGEELGIWRGLLGRTAAVVAKPAAHRGAMTLADQCVSSVSNFAVNVLIARSLGPTGFGVFALLFAVWLLALGLQRALLIEPMTILAGDLSGDELSGFLRASARLAAQADVCVGTIAALVGAVVWMGFGGTTGVGIFGFGIALGPLLFQDFVRWRFFTSRRPARSLINDIVFAGAEIALVGSLAIAHRLTVFSGFAAIAVGAATASALGAWQGRGAPRSNAWTSRKLFEKKAVVGKWLLADFGTLWIASQASLFIVAGLLGRGDAGIMRVLVDLFGPSRVFVAGIAGLLLPLASRRFSTQGKPGLDKVVRGATGVVLLSTALYAVVLSVGGGWVLRTFYGPAYSGASPLIWLAGVQFVFMSLQQPITLGLKSSRQAKSLFFVRVAIATISVSASFLLIIPFGLRGALTAGAVAAAAGVFLLGRQYGILRPRESS